MQLIQIKKYQKLQNTVAMEFSCYTIAKQSPKCTTSCAVTGSQKVFAFEQYNQHGPYKIFTLNFTTVDIFCPRLSGILAFSNGDEGSLTTNVQIV